MPKTGSTKDRLLETATQEFSRQGAQAVGVEQLCKKANINKGSFYHFFASKEALIIACLNAEWDDLRTNIYEPAFAHETSPLMRISTFFDLTKKRQETLSSTLGLYPGCLFCTLGNELALQCPIVSEQTQEYFRRTSAYLYTALSDAFDERSVKSDPSELAEQIALIIHAAHLKVKMTQTLEPLEVANTLFRHLTSTIVENS